MLEIHPRSYRSPVSRKIRRVIPIFLRLTLLKLPSVFIHWRGPTHPDTDRNVETLTKASRGPIVYLAVRVPGTCRIRDGSSGVYGILLGMQP
jgi:hypothetical protein